MVGWVYESNRDSIKSAQKDLDDFYNQDKVDDLNNAKEKEVEILDERLQNWEDYLSALKSQYEEYERLEEQKLLMELLGVSSEEEVEAIIESDMVDFTEYMNTHLDDFFTDQISAWGNFNSVFGQFLDDYRENCEALGELKITGSTTVSADTYEGKNTGYKDVNNLLKAAKEEEEDENLLSQIVENDKTILSKAGTSSGSTTTTTSTAVTEAQVKAAYDDINSGKADKQGVSRSEYLTKTYGATVASAAQAAINEAYKTKNVSKAITNATNNANKNATTTTTTSTANSISKYADANGYVNYSAVANDKYASGDYSQAIYDLVLAQAKIDSNSETYGQYNGGIQKTLDKWNTELSSKTDSTNTTIKSFNTAYTNAQTAANALAARNLDITSNEAQFTIALASNLPSELSENSAEQLAQMIQSTGLFCSTADEVGLSVTGTLTDTAETLGSNFDDATNKIIEFLTETLGVDEETASSMVSSAESSYNSGGGKTAAERLAEQGVKYNTAKSTLDSLLKDPNASQEDIDAAKQAMAEAHTEANKIRVNEMGIDEDSINDDGTIKKHDGMDSGLIGNVPIDKSKEVIITALKGEGVFTDDQMEAIAKALSLLEDTAEVANSSNYTALSSLGSSWATNQTSTSSDNILSMFNLKKPSFESSLDSNSGDTWNLNGDIVLENCDDPAEFWNQVTQAMSNRFNVTKRKLA